MWLFILSTNVLPPIISGSEVLSKIHSKLLCPCIGFKTADWAQTFISTFLKVLISFIKKLLRIINDKSVIGIKRGTWYIVSTRKSIQNWIHNESKCFNIPRGGLVAKLCPTLVIPWTVAHQFPLSMGFSRKNTGVGCYLICLGIHLFSWWLSGKEFACNAGDLCLIPGWGRSPGEGNGNTLQCSCLENPHGQRNPVSYSPQGH